MDDTAGHERDVARPEPPGQLLGAGDRLRRGVDADHLGVGQGEPVGAGQHPRPAPDVEEPGGRRVVFEPPPQPGGGDHHRAGGVLGQGGVEVAVQQPVAGGVGRQDGVGFGARRLDEGHDGVVGLAHLPEPVGIGRRPPPVGTRIGPFGQPDPGEVAVRLPLSRRPLALAPRLLTHDGSSRAAATSHVGHGVEVGAGVGHGGRS
jgi:hypothetical protein